MVELKYLGLKMQNSFDIVKLRDKLNEIIGPDNSIGISMKWSDIADVLIECESKEVEDRISAFIDSQMQFWNSKYNKKSDEMKKGAIEVLEQLKIRL